MKKYNDAINVGLQAIGEQTLDVNVSIDGIYEAEQMDTLIELIKEEVISSGFSFNTDENWKFLPDTNGYITIPETVLRVDPSSTASKIIRKDGKLYDKTAQSYKFTTGVACDVVWNIDFDDMPVVFQNYITLKAARVLNQRLVGDLSAVQLQMKDEQEAWLRVIEHEDDVEDNNIFDDTSVSRIISRTSNPVGLRG